MVWNSDFCQLWCTKNAFEIGPKEHLQRMDLVLGRELDRTLYFSIVGNRPQNSVVALVGLCPGANQLDAFLSYYNSGLALENAAQNSGFSHISANLIPMLNILGIDKIIGERIIPDYDLNRSEKFFITSLVKCASLQSGKKPSQSFDPSMFEMTKQCIKNRFVSDILNPGFTNLKLVIILGRDGWNAISTINIDSMSIRDYLEMNGKVLVRIPHPSGRSVINVQKFLRDPENPMRIEAGQKLARFL